MDFQEDSLKWFGGRVTELIKGKSLSRENIKKMMIETLTGVQPELQQGAFLASLRMKGETEDEIAGCFEAVIEADTNIINMDDLPVVENCGTGMDSLKTFNISTLSAVVASCLEVPVARHGARAISSRCGTVDLCEALGVDVECDVEMVRQSIEKCGLGLFNGTSLRVHPVGLGRILSQIRFGTTLNIAASLANPARPRIAVRGVGSPDQIEPTLKVMRSIGYRRGLVFHGFNSDRSAGMDELSSLGVSRVGFFEKGKDTQYFEITPEDAGLPVGNYEKIRPDADRETEALKAVNLLAGRGDNSRSDIVALNAGAVLWMSGKTRNLKEGVSAAGMMIREGKALDRLVSWVSMQNRNPEAGRGIVNNLIRKSGIK